MGSPKNGETKEPQSHLGPFRSCPKTQKSFSFNVWIKKSPGRVFLLAQNSLYSAVKDFFVYNGWVTLDFCTLNKFQPLYHWALILDETPTCLYLVLVNSLPNTGQLWPTVMTDQDLVWSNPTWWLYGMVLVVVVAAWLIEWLQHFTV